MKVFNKTRGTMETVPNIEVNVDTVYIRTNIVKIEEPEFIGWEYDEVQYDQSKYLEQYAIDTYTLELIEGGYLV
jgi:hypothetical protein